MTASTRPLFKRGSLGAAQYVFAAALVVRLMSLSRLSHSALNLSTGSDMRFYDEWAQRILNGQLTDHRAFYGQPLYAYSLAALYKIFGTGAYVPLLLQAIADAATCALIYKISVVVFRNADHVIKSHWVGVAAAATWVFYVPAQAYTVVLMPAAYGVLVFWFVVWQVLDTRGRLTPLRSFLLALLVGFAAMAVANLLLLLVLILVAAFTDRSNRRLRWRSIASVFAGAIIGTAPCWLHNCCVARDPVFLSAHSGVNFWVGNNREATGYPHLPGMRAGQAEMLEDSINIAQASAGRELKRSEISAYWSTRASKDIIADPARWLLLVAKKFAKFWNAFEYDDLNVIQRLRNAGIIFAGPHYGIVAALAIGGIVFGIANARASLWLFAAIVLHLTSILPVFVTERYRLAVVPGLLIFAAFGAGAAFENVARSRYRQFAAYVAIVGVAAAFVWAPQKDPALAAFRSYQTAIQALDSGDLGKAEDALDLAYRYAPSNVEINFARGNLAQRKGRLAEAKQFYRATLAIDPTHKRALNNIGLIALDEGDFDSAATYFGAILKTAPNDAKAHYLLARAELGAGHADQALTESETAVKLEPTQQAFIELRDQIRPRP
jgi:tetratricopeptide (TPR) repeat protein